MKVFALSLSPTIPNKPGVYQIGTRCGRFRYIGSSFNLRKRYCDHLRDLVMNRHNNRSLQQIFFQRNTVIFFKILQLCQPHELVRIEQKFLDNAFKRKTVECLNRKKKSGSGH